jgi:hypothetical protein
MSITNVQLIGDALRELNVISEIQTPSPEQGAHALRKLNQMMAEWEEAGVRLEYFAQTIMSEDCPIPAYAESGVTAHLATRIAGTYGAEVSIATAAAATRGYETILRTAMNAALPVSLMLTRPRGSGDRNFIDITTI